MKILFINAYFYPEEIAFSHLERDILDGLVGIGAEIEVICPVPTRGVSREKAKSFKKVRREKVFGVNVTRFWAPREGSNPLARALRYFWCNLRQYQIALRYKGIDAVFAVSTPPTQGFLAGKISKKLKCRFIYSLQDVFPDSMVNTGMISRGGLLWKIGRVIENYTYKYADKIIVISKGFQRNIINKGVPEEKIEFISNWIDADQVQPVPSDHNRLYNELKIDRDKFTVVYAGNFGASQGADIVIKAAEKLDGRNDIQFVIFGGGSEFDAAKEYACSRNLKNLKMFGLLPSERISEVYSLGDVALITGKAGIGKSGMPSKTWSIMACNTPIIASFDKDSDLADVLKDSGAGYCVAPGNSDSLVSAILCECESGGKRSNGREYVSQYASKEVCIKKYIAAFYK